MEPAQAKPLKRRRRWLIAAFIASVAVAVVLSLLSITSDRSSADVFRAGGVVDFVLLPHLLALQAAVLLGALAAIASGYERATALNGPDAGRPFARARLCIVASCAGYVLSIGLIAEARRAGMFGFGTAALAFLLVLLPSIGLAVGTTVWAVLQLAGLTHGEMMAVPSERSTKTDE